MDANDIDSKLATIDLRLQEIEARISILPKVQGQKTPPVQKVNENVQVQVDSQVSSQSVSSWNWLGIIGIFCLICAAVFIIKLSIDSGWLTHARQIGLVNLLGLALIVSGLRLQKLDLQYASFLPAAGIIILYLAAYAARNAYELISFETAMIEMCVISVGCIYLYKLIKHDIYPIITTIGVYGFPILFNLQEYSFFTLYFYLICSLAFAAISVWMQARTLAVLGSYFAIFCTSWVGMSFGNYPLIAFALAMHFVIYLIGSYYYTRVTQIELTTEQAWSFFPVLILFYSMEYYFIDAAYPGFAPWISLIFAGLLIAIYSLAKKFIPNKKFNSFPVVMGFASLVLFHSGYLELLPDALCYWLFTVIVLLGAVIPRSWFGNKSITWSVAFIPVAAVSVILAIELFNMLYHMIFSSELNPLIASFAAAVSLWVLFVARFNELGQQQYFYGILAVAHLLVITALYNLTNDMNSLAISASWLLYAFAVIAFAFTRKDKLMAQSALVVLAFAAGKALLYDVAAAATVVRIFCLLLTGVVLYGAGFVLKKISAWK